MTHLSISKYAHIVSIQSTLNKLRYLTEHSFLTTLRTKHMIILKIIHLITAALLAATVLLQVYTCTLNIQCTSTCRIRQLENMCICA